MAGEVCAEYVHEHSGSDAGLVQCGRPVYTRGWCVAHDARARRGYPMDAYVRKFGRRDRTCSELIREHSGVDAVLVRCGRPVYGNEWCGMHYKRFRDGVSMEKPISQKDRRRSREEIRARDKDGRKLCSTCKNALLETEFAPQPNTADGLAYQCNLCVNLLRYGLNRNKLVALLESQGYQCANPGCDTAIEVWERASGANRRKPRRSDGVSVVCVDHDHSCCSGERSCGKCVRGLLCWYCNAAAGMLNDEPKRLLGLAEYLTGEMNQVEI